MGFNIAKYPTLALVGSTQELHLLPKEGLPGLCNELRCYLFDSVSRSSGHLTSGLDTVELTVALRYVYNTPFDQLIWDMGRQACPHKIPTGRRDKIDTIRQKDGLYPFPWRSESEYDVLSVGHSSTSVNADIGIAVTAEKEGEKRHTIYVTGDGAITVGMAFEAMNRMDDIRPDILVILNDSEISISENVDALSNHLAQLLSDKLYSSLREGGKKVFSGVPSIKELLKRTEGHIRDMVVPGTLFEELGFNYIGPVGGHNVLGLITTLKNMRDLEGLRFLHIMTRKGRGYEPAEKGPIAFHAAPKLGPSNRYPPKNSSGLLSYSKIFGDWLCETAARDNKLMAITPAMREGSGVVEFSRKFSSRYFDVAITEQHIVTFAVGLTIGGYKPVVAIHSTFLQRACDQMLHDVAIQRLPVLLAVGRIGIIGADGQTRQGAFDLSFLRYIPEMVIVTPSGENGCRQTLFTGYHYDDGPTVMHYPCDNAIGVELTPLEQLSVGEGIMKHHGEKVAVPDFDILMPEAAQVTGSLNATLVDMRFVKPLDEVLILEVAAQHEVLITIEEDAIIGGAGSGVNEVLMAHRRPVLVLNIGLSDFFIPQGTQDGARAGLGLNAAGTETKIKAWLAQSSPRSCYA